MLRPTPRWLLPLLALILALSGCATRAPAPDAQHLLHDELFARPARAFDAESLFELSPEMKEYLRVRLPQLSPRNDPRQALLDALYSQRDLRLAYCAWPTTAATR